ncbi:hypothetical protein ACFQ3K_06665 [Brucella gallinifaecis]|uniref:Uncharacterized protein n=1 Tax=Brucella gallinifaecis TaxID=215590 RepID=A0A502BM08_9HYPH|nr:hypothetical protein [Brucella gallinifaecis]TPF74346.1 hypothetical protein FHY56_14645 [Brucella gallinifaecis]
MMLTTKDWAEYQQWHELLDALCTKEGHLDNMALADALCATSKNQTQAAFDAAVKNLRNWRMGIHIPQRKNFILLGKILKVDRDNALRDAWNRLYSQAKVKPSTDDIVTGMDDETPPPASSAKSVSKQILIAGGVAAALVTGVFVIDLSGSEKVEDTDPVASYEGIVADYVRNVSAKVGDSLIIHGARGNECGDAPTWESAKLLLPELVTGTLTDGGVGTRNSRQCGGRIPARAIMFTATKPGTEQISLYGDDIVIRVTE